MYQYIQKKSLNGRSPLTTIAKENHSREVTNTYMFLNLILMDEIELMELLPDFFSQEDLLYINSLLVRIAVHEVEEKGKAIEKSNYPSLLNNVNEPDDIDDYSSENTSYILPTKRSHLIDTSESNKDDRIRVWLAECKWK